MMAEALLKELEKTGVTLRVAGGDLHVRAPKGVITPEVRKALCDRKPDLIRLLSLSILPSEFTAFMAENHEFDAKPRCPARWGMMTSSLSLRAMVMT